MAVTKKTIDKLGILGKKKTLCTHYAQSPSSYDLSDSE